MLAGFRRLLFVPACKWYLNSDLLEFVCLFLSFEHAITCNVSTLYHPFIFPLLDSGLSFNIKPFQ